MRASLLTAVPVLAALTALPAVGQVSARIHLDIPIGRRPPVTYAAPRQRLAIRDYDERRFGLWEDYYDEWIPETVYQYDGNYYDYPVVPFATSIIVYRYRNEIFFAPRQREFIQWRDYRDVYRGNGRSYYPPGRNDRNDRDDRRYEPSRPRNDNNQYRGGQQDGRNGGGMRPPQQDGRSGGGMRPPQQDGRSGGGMRPPQQDGRSGGGMRPPQQGSGRDNRPAQDNRGGQAGGGSRSRPHGG